MINQNEDSGTEAGTNIKKYSDYAALLCEYKRDVKRSYQANSVTPALFWASKYKKGVTIHPF